MDYNKILNEIYNEVKSDAPAGKPASYIPELALVNADKYGISLITVEGNYFSAGDSDEDFSIQSISKVFSLAMAFSAAGERIWDRIGTEPSGNAFNSIMQLEYEKGKPRNPFINAGALVVADILVSHLSNPKNDYLDFIQRISRNSEIRFDEKIAHSEKETGFRNAALINMMKSYGNINNDIETVLDFYFYQCSVKMSCRDLAFAFLPFADLTHEFSFNNVVLTKSQVKRINALMITCGLYDESGDFTFRVGLPGKSGVGGGIAAIHPNQYSAAVWSPRINEKGNSVYGIKSLELLTTKTEKSIC
jgi:glutaminase